MGKLTNEADKQLPLAQYRSGHAAGNKVIKCGDCPISHRHERPADGSGRILNMSDREPQAIMGGRPSIDPTTKGPEVRPRQNGIRDETKNSAEFYRLRGVKSPSDQFGKNNELSNTLIEPMQRPSSHDLSCQRNGLERYQPQSGRCPVHDPVAKSRLQARCAGSDRVRAGRRDALPANRLSLVDGVSCSQ